MITRNKQARLDSQFKPGDTVFFKGGPDWLKEDSMHGELRYGNQYNVEGPCESEVESEDKGKYVALKDPYIAHTIRCDIKLLSRSPPPPLPDGYKGGDDTYFVGPAFLLPGNIPLTYGDLVWVLGPAYGLDLRALEGVVTIRSPKLRATFGFHVSRLSRAPPPLPGNYKPRDKVYFTGSSDTFSGGAYLVHGHEGEVVGPVMGQPVMRRGGGGAWLLGEPTDGRADASRLMIRFQNNQRDIVCFVNQLSYSPPPPLPGNYKIGEKLYYIGANETFTTGNRLVHGEQGEVKGPGTGECEGRLLIRFPNNQSNIVCFVNQLSYSPPPPLPGNYKIGEKLYYIGANEMVSNGDHLVHGKQGEVKGPGTGEWEGRVLIKFPNNKVNIACFVNQLSYSPPPPLPGNYKIGEKLYYIGASGTVSTGDRLMHGEQGEVKGPGTGKWERRLLIKFPNNPRSIACTLVELSYSPPPPLPGNYKIGEKLYYIGASGTVSTGDRLVHGEQGEVTGPGIGKWEGRLSIKFPSKKDNICGIACTLAELSRSQPPQVAAGYKVGEKLYYIGKSGEGGVDGRLLRYADRSLLRYGEQCVVIGSVLTPDNNNLWSNDRLLISFESAPKDYVIKAAVLSRELPGGFDEKDELYVTGVNLHLSLEYHSRFDRFNPLDHYGKQCSVIGPGDEGRVLIKMVSEHESDYYAQLDVRMLSRYRPPTRTSNIFLSEKGHNFLGGEVYYAAHPRIIGNGKHVAYGYKCDVVGAKPGLVYDELILRLRNNLTFTCAPSEISETAPPLLPVKYKVDDRLYFTGTSHNTPDGRNRLVYGDPCEVMGPMMHDGKRCMMKFLQDDNTFMSSCDLETLSRDKPPQLPGGITPGTMLYYTGLNSFPRFLGHVVHGNLGEVVGLGTTSDQVAVLFADNKSWVSCKPSDLSRGPPAELPGGYKPRDLVYYCEKTTIHWAEKQTARIVVYGDKGEVIGPNPADANQLTIQFPSDKTFCCSTNDLSRSPPAQQEAPTQQEAIEQERSAPDVSLLTLLANRTARARNTPHQKLNQTLNDLAHDLLNKVIWASKNAEDSHCSEFDIETEHAKKWQEYHNEYGIDKLFIHKYLPVAMQTTSGDGLKMKWLFYPSTDSTDKVLVKWECSWAHAGSSNAGSSNA